MITELKKNLDKALSHLRQEFAGLHVGRANATLVDEISVESYGTQMPLKSMANISCPDSKTIRIEPWDKSVIAEIEKSIRNSDIGIQPQNMGEHILLSVPPLTEERRQQIVKRVHEESENARISVRNVRHEMLKKVKQQKDAGDISEDEVSKLEKQIQEAVDNTNKTIDEMTKKKESDVLTV
jgi:ribosome recycling factor